MSYEGKYREELKQTVQQLCADGKGILAADESIGTIGKRFGPISVENIHSNRFKYRHMLFTSPNISDHISGVITFEETLFDTERNNNTKLIQPLLDAGVVVGIKTDTGLFNFSNQGEQVTMGLDDLNERSQKYYEAGARFAKWRCVYHINDEQFLPTSELILKNARTLALYAKISQECGLVPIVEPEVMIVKENTLERVQEVTTMVLKTVYQELAKLEVPLELTLLKPNMVRTHSGPEAKVIAEGTLQVLKECVPKEVPGIVFLSGGMTETEATQALDMINKIANEKPEQEYPWRLSFSYGRALQQSVLNCWQGKEENCGKAQEIFQRIAKDNGLASMGSYQNDN